MWVNKVGWLLAAALTFSVVGMADPVAGNPPLVEGQTGLAVWLERETATSRETVLKPYLKSLQPLPLAVRVSLTQKGRFGTSTIEQRVRFQAPAGVVEAGHANQTGVPIDLGDAGDENRKTIGNASV